MIMCRAAGLEEKYSSERISGMGRGDVLDIIGSRDERCILIGIALSGEKIAR